MNYYKRKNRDKFIKYWKGEAQKKIFRCSKELGFYGKLKKVLSPNGGCIINDKNLHAILSEVMNNLHQGKDELINFDSLLEDSNVEYCEYPVYSAIHNEIFLSHVYSLVILQKCNISYSLLADAFKWMTKEIFKNKPIYCKYKILIGYIRIFIS